jgi:hypothetical protein
MKKYIRWAACVGISAAWGIGGPVAYAQTNAIANGNWSSGSTWSAGVPTDTLTAAINGGRTVTINSTDPLTSLADVGSIAGETGTLSVQTGAYFNLFQASPAPDPPVSALRLGQIAGATGNLNMSGGTIFISEDTPNVFDNGDLIVAQNGTGVATVSGGELIAGDEIFVGQNAGSNGTLTINGDGKVSAGRRNIQIGFGAADIANALPGAAGTVNVSGSGQLIAGDTIFLGFGSTDLTQGQTGASANLNITGGKVTTGGWLQTGFGTGSTSHVTQTGGEAAIGGLLVHGARGHAVFDHSGGKFSANLVIIGDGVDLSGSYGEYNMSGSAELNSNLIMWVGAWGKSHGVVNQSGGTANVGALTVGRNGTGEYNLSAGTVNVNGGDGYAPNNHFKIGVDGGGADDQGTGFVNQTGGTITVKTGVFIGDLDHSEGTYKISGGTLNVTGTGTHPNLEGHEDFIGDFSVGGALASNAKVDRVESTGVGDAQGQALDAKGTFIVSGSAATINIAGNFLANPADKSQYRSDPLNPGGSNSATLGFEIFNSTGTSLINVGGAADLDGAVIDMDLMNGFTPAVNATFNLLSASSFGQTGTGTTQNVGTGKGFTLAAEDAGAWSLAVVPLSGKQVLQATFLGAVGLPGDFNNDGLVDGRDLLLWQRNTSIGSLADWKANYGQGSLAGVSAVPEPGSLVLIGAMGVLVCLGRARRG